MKLSLLQENLNSALSNVSRFVSSKSQLPILNNILITTDNGRLKLSATNLELGINYWVGAKIEQEGVLALPAKEITEFVSYLSSGKIDCELNDKNLLSIFSTKAESTFATIPATDFPTIPSINPSTAFEIDLSLLATAVSQVAFAAASDDSRPILTAILCKFTSQSFTLVATDGFRLSLKTIKLVNPIKLNDGQEELTFLIPARSLIEVTKLAKNTKKITIGLTSDGHQVVFVLDDLELVSRLIEGDYPDFKRIIPDSFTTRIFINREEFSQAVKIASVFARESANVVRFNLKANALELTANAPQIGQNRATVEAKIEGNPFQVAFNFKFINDFLNICKGEEILIELNETFSPVSFQDQSDPSLTHIIGPVSVQN
ncbi:MAG: DNA polymerase III subunit beta [Candidatus Shapirobacteria bacterium]|nr:DNA polymerase III subunit beta [Candidatus Shapirobacteria bacterium]